MKQVKNSFLDNIEVVCDLDIKRYLGVWYEIARFPHVFERGLDHVTATYEAINPVKIRVINKGLYKGKTKTAKGNAKIMNLNCLGHLGVSFFPLFRSPYLIIKIDQKNYQYAVVTSGEDYLWILSKTPQLDEKIYQSLVKFIVEKGFNVNKLQRVKQD